MKCYKEPKIVLQLTPPGRGAVATVRIEGPDCVATVDRFFASRSGKRLAETPTDRPLVGHFHAPTSPVSEEVVARRCPEYCNQETYEQGSAVEIHCHGGTASVSRIVEMFQESGYESISWNEWADFGSGWAESCSGRTESCSGRTGQKPDQDREDQSSTRVEAYRDLARAQTELTASLLLDQYHGALDRELCLIDQSDDPAEKKRRLEVLLDRATWGIHLTRPWQIVLVGSPNVGKSSLMNRLLGYDRAIIDATPGTTRDLVRAQSVFGGWPVELIDTAGLREGDHPVEQLGVKLALAQLQSADLVLLLLDATRPPTEEELSLIKRLEDHTSPRSLFLPVRSKADLVEDRLAWGPFAETTLAANAIDTSATSGEGVNRLIAAIESHLFPLLPDPSRPIPWTERQIAILVDMVEKNKRASGFTLN